jgi:hypothetical protein
MFPSTVPRLLAVTHLNCKGKGVKNPFKRPVLTNVFDRLLLFLLQVSKIGSISVSFAPCCYSTLPSVSSKNSKLVPL